MFLSCIQHMWTGKSYIPPTAYLNFAPADRIADRLSALYVQPTGTLHLAVQQQLLQSTSFCTKYVTESLTLQVRWQHLLAGLWQYDFTDKMYYWFLMHMLQNGNNEKL